MESKDESHEVAQTTYLPEGMDKRLGALVRATLKNQTAPASATAFSTGKKRKNESAAVATPTTKRVKKPKVAKAERTPSKPAKRASTKKQVIKDDDTPPPIRTSERRRSGRQSIRVTSYKENDAETDEEGYGEEESSDEEMGDADSRESESEPEPRPRKSSRYAARSSSGGGSAKRSTEPRGAEKEKAMEGDRGRNNTSAPEEEMEVDGPELRPAAKKDEAAATPTTTTVAVGRRSTRGSVIANFKPFEPKKTQKEIIDRQGARDAKGKQKEVAAVSNESSDLSDVPDGDD